MPPKPPVGNVIWKMLALSGNDSIDVVDLLGEQLRLLERRVRRRLDDAEEDTPWSSAGASSRCENM